jgi:putative phosphoesterase
MKLLIFSDVHGDLLAVEAALGHAGRLGCTAVVCGGDLVDGDPLAEEVIALLRERAVPCIRGNHDRWAIGAGRAIEPNGGLVGAPYDASSLGLSRRAIRYLSKLPTYWEMTADDLRIAMHHGRPGDDMHGVFPDLDRADVCTLLEAAGTDVLLLGHTHEAFVATLGDRRLIANPGSLWRGAGGTFGVLDTKSCRFTVYRTSGEEVTIPRRSFL